MFILNDKDHLKEVNKLVISDALKLISATSLLGRGAKHVGTELLRDILVDGDCLSHFEVSIDDMRKVREWHESRLRLGPFLLPKRVLFVFPVGFRITQ